MNINVASSVKWLSVALLLALGVACSGGKAIGETCTSEGSTSECESSAVCAKDTSDVIKCLKVCVDKSACGATEECNGVTGSSIKACRIKK
jgi:hypothetical protein